MRLLKERHDLIQPTIDSILFCYSQWQPSYDELKKTVPSVHFHQGPPSLKTMESLQNGILVLDDLMEEVIKDINIMNMFIVGSHHKSISVLFLMQNIFQKGPHSRTISINTQYMTLFKNARDQTQIRILARQIFPSDWRSFLKYYEDETNKAYGHVILDFHPTTHNDDRIVKMYGSKEATPKIEDTSKQHLLSKSQQDSDKESKQQEQPSEEPSEQQQPNAIKSIPSNGNTINQREEQSVTEIRDILSKQQHDLELIHESLFDLKQSAARNRFESDDLASDYQNKQKQDLEVIKQSLIELKQSMKRSRSEPDVLDKGSSSYEEDNKTNNHSRDRNKDSEDSRKRKKRLVRDNVPNDWNAPL